jgi:hypothetical protein
MENNRNYLVIATNTNGFEKLWITATTKFHALELAYSRHPKYTKYQCVNVVRRRKSADIIAKF